MNSAQLLSGYSFPEYSQPSQIQVNYASSQPQNYQNFQNILTTQEEYPVTNYTNSQINNINYGDTTYSTPSLQINTIPIINSIDQNNINQFSNIDGQMNTYEAYPATDYNASNINFDQPINNQFDYNNEINTNLNVNILEVENIGSQINTNTEINQKNSVENVIQSNIANQGSGINLDKIQNQESNQKIESPFNQFSSTITVNENLEPNQSSSIPNQIIIGNSLNQEPQLISTDSNQSHPRIKANEKVIKEPTLIDPLKTKIPQSPLKEIAPLEKEEIQLEKIKDKNESSFKEEESKNLTKDEKNLLKEEKISNKKELDIKSHFDLILIKDENLFFYKKVNKVSTPLLAHYEMPENLEYKNPILSPNEKYFACIGKGDEDSVFVWDLSDLYWYKYKFSYSKVDTIIFTPDSKSIIIVYSNSNPIMYDLSTGKMNLEFEMNGKENDREVLQCGFTNSNTHFALTTTNSYTLWSLRTGKIKQKIFDNSPIKIISNDHLIYIDSQLNCLIKKITDQSIKENFAIKGVESTEDILAAGCTKDMANFIYVIKHGIIVYNFKNKEFNGLQKFQCGVERASLSQDGKYVMKTNMKDLCIYDLVKGTIINTILKDKFKEYNIDYNLKKIIIIDNISITIQDFIEENSPEKYIWLNKNPTKFEEVKFSHDLKILLARLNRNEAVAYDSKTGYILKKWINIDENWLDYCITNFGGDKIAAKSNLFLIKVWNFSTGKEEASFYGFNSHSLCFNSNGDYLACGTKNGSEIARIWSIPEQKYGIYKFYGNNNNFHTKVHLTSPVPKNLICCSVDQRPLVFNSYTKELLYQCECPYRFEEIYGIQSELRYNIFIIKGRDNQKRNIGILYRLSDGALLNTYENYTVLELIRFEGIIISKCQDSKLITTDYKMLENPKSSEFQIQNDKCELLNDHKSAFIEFGDEFSKEFDFINIQNGNFIGKLNYVKKNERYSEIYITADSDNDEIYFRYFEFFTPEETMVYLKKNIFDVQENNA